MTPTIPDIGVLDSTAGFLADGYDAFRFPALPADGVRVAFTS